MYEEVLKRVIAARKGAKISQKKMSEALGRSSEYVYLMENQKVPLRMQDYLGICEVLQMSPAELLQEGESKEQDNLYGELNELSERDKQILKGVLLLLRLHNEKSEK